MVKIIVNLYPTIPAASEEERRALRPIGRNSERYHEVLKGWMDIVRACDALEGGVWGCSAIEHHFHSEGYEVSPNPGVINAYWAAITKHVHVGQMGYVMSAHNPLRIAEETAILDHMLEGRSFVGFARGYQSRWTQVHGQHLGSRATLSDNSADDRLNREIYEENVDLVIKAWTQDSIEHNSSRWQIPYPHDTGIENWFMGEWTKELGAPGEMGDDGALHRTCVVPSPYTKPHPPVFVPSNASQETVEYCGRKGFIPNYFTTLEKALTHAPAYIAAGKEQGKEYVLGQNQAQTRWVTFGENEADTRRKIAEYDGDIWKHFYSPLINGQLQGGTGKGLPRDATREDAVDPILSSGLWAAGTVPQVRDYLVKEWKAMPAEYLTLIVHYAQMPKEETIQTIETLVKEIKPDLDELTRKVDEQSAAAAEAAAAAAAAG